MDFHPANKKNKDPIHTLKKTKLLPLTTHKYKKQPRAEIGNQSRDPRIATFDSLQLNKLVCCEGIKLGNRQNFSVEKRIQRKKDRFNYPAKRQSLNEEVLKILKTSTIDNYSLGIKSLLAGTKGATHQIKVKLNPQDTTNLRNIRIISRNELMVSKKEKNDPLGFLKSKNRIVALRKYQKECPILDIHTNLLQPYSLVHLESATYLVVDQCNCQTLKSLIAEFGKLNPKMSVKHIKQLVSAVAHLQSNGLTHNRINLQSILHNGEGEVVLNLIKSSDKPISEDQKQKYFHYFCPEIITSKNTGFGEKADVWAIGCVALQLLSFSSLKNNPMHPYNRNSKIYKNQESVEIIEAVQKVMAGNSKLQKLQSDNPQRTTLRQEARQISASGLQFIGRCLSVDVKVRPTIEQLLCHPFLN